jgi:outer membrane autotransporter protein
MASSARAAACALNHFFFAAVALLGFALPALAQPAFDPSYIGIGPGLIDPALIGGRPLIGDGTNGSDGAPGQVTSTLSNGTPLQGGSGGNGGSGGLFFGNGGRGGTGGNGAVVTGSGSSSNSSLLTGGAGGTGGTAGLFGSGGSGGNGGMGVSFGASGAVFTTNSTIAGANGGAGGSAGFLFGNGGNGGAGGAGVTGTALTVTNQGSIAGGNGGAGGSSGNFPFASSGNGGAGGAGLTGTGLTIVNAAQASITGGAGGAAGAAGLLGKGGNGGNGGAGISGTGLSITNQGTITGGSGGAGSAGLFGRGANGTEGAGITGSNLTIVNSGIIAGGEGFTQANAITFTGGGNTLTVLQGARFLGNIGVTGSLDFDQDTTAVLTNVITGTGSVSKSGAGTLSLFGTSTYSGGTTVNAGTLRLDGGSLAATGALTVNGGTFDLNGFDQTVGSLGGSGGIVSLGSGTLTVDGSASSTFAGAITGSGGVTKQGSGTLTLSGINIYTGSTVINAGVLALSGSLTSNTVVNAGGTLLGNGTITGNVTVAGTMATSDLLGTFNVTGSYTQSPNSTYFVGINSAGQSGKVNVTGNAVLNGGTVFVQARNGTYVANTSYTILSATGTVSGAFAGVNSNFAFLAPTLSYDTHDVTLTLLVPGFRHGAQNANQGSVAVVLDQIGANATGDFAKVMNAIYVLDTAQGPKVLQTIGGQSYSNFSSVAVQGTQTFMDSFQAQAGGGVSGGGGAALPSSTWQALRTDGADACETACDVEPLWGVWGGGMGAFGTVAGNANAAGLTYSLGGFLAGIDRRFAPGLRLGVTTGFNAASLYSNGVPGYGTSNTLQFALYGEYAPGAFYLDALAGYGHSDNRMNRPIVIPGLPFRTAHGYTTANTFFGQLEAGYKLTVVPSFGGFVTPFARLQASTSTQNGFTESGANSLNLTVAAQTTQSLRTVLGTQLGAAIDAPWREKLDVTLRFGWSHEFADTTRPVSAAFIGAPALGFTTFGATAPRDGAVLGLALKTAIAESTSLYFRYDGDLAGSNTNHVLNAGVRYVW